MKNESIAQYSTHSIAFICLYYMAGDTGLKFLAVYEVHALQIDEVPYS